MIYQVRILLQDGTSRIVKYSHDYDAAIKALLHIADQRLTYLATLPLMDSVQLIAGDRIEFDMRVIRTATGGDRPETDAAGGMTQGPPAQSIDLDLGKPQPGAEPGVGEMRSAELLLMSSFSHPLSALDMLTRWESSRPNEAGFYSGIDNAAKAVRVMGCGIWREDEADRYFDQQSRIVDQARRRFGALRVFFDVRNWVVEDSRSVLQFQEMNKALYGPDDRRAAVVRSSGEKKHPRAALNGGNTEVFVSLNAAELWLHAA